MNINNTYTQTVTQLIMKQNFLAFFNKKNSRHVDKNGTTCSTVMKFAYM